MIGGHNSPQLNNFFLNIPFSIFSECLVVGYYYMTKFLREILLVWKEN